MKTKLKQYINLLPIIILITLIVGAGYFLFGADIVGDSASAGDRSSLEGREVSEETQMPQRLP